ncbi:SRPBCC family protein [Georgenia sp. Z1344]|uniref:SRPBCC family protein n=1 Tax=Georgenia sp. Z1344 TaxID=3416706 RepID=UPI003CF63CFF
MSHDIEVTVTVDAPRPEVWRAFTVDVGMRPWWWADAGDVTFDLPERVDGRYRIASRSWGIAVSGWLLESDPPARQVVTWLPEGEAPPADPEFDQVTISLEPDGFGTAVTVHHTTHLSDPSEVEKAWQRLLDALVHIYDNTH